MLSALERLRFAVALKSTRLRQAHGDLQILISDALSDGVEARLLVKPTGMPIAMIHRIASWCEEDDGFSGRSASTHLEKILEKKAEIAQAATAKTAAEKQEALFLAYVHKNGLVEVSGPTPGSGPLVHGVAGARG